MTARKIRTSPSIACTVAACHIPVFTSPAAQVHDFKINGMTDAGYHRHIIGFEA